MMSFGFGNIPVFAAPKGKEGTMADFVQSVVDYLDEENAWYCFNRMGTLKEHGNDVLRIIRNSLKNKCKVFFDKEWMNHPKFLGNLAGFVQKQGDSGPSGKDILTEIDKFLSPGDAKNYVQNALALRTDPAKASNAVPITKPTQDQVATIAKINAAINSYAKKEEILKYCTLPVDIASIGREMDRGIYFHPTLANMSGKPLLGRVKAEQYSCLKEPGSAELSETLYANIHMHLGGELKDKSEAFIRSVVMHEVVHVRQYLDLRKLYDDLSSDLRKLNFYVSSAGGTPAAEMEVEAYAVEIVEFFDELPDDDMEDSFRGYLKYYHKASEPWHGKSKKLIVGKVTTSLSRKQRCLKLLDKRIGKMKKDKSQHPDELKKAEEFRKEVAAAKITA